MSNPTKPKEAKPRAEADDFEIKATSGITQQNGGNSVVTTIIIVAVAAVVIIITNYFLVDIKVAQVSKQIGSISAIAGDEDATDDGEGVAQERGIILDLGEFILNLSDSGARKFLKVNVAVELSKKNTDDSAPAKKGGHGHDEAPTMSAVESEMNQYKPSIRDSVISVLSSKTSDELSTTPGKELAKEQIKESIDAIFEGEREVLRVSFGSFFIQ